MSEAAETADEAPHIDTALIVNGVVRAVWPDVRAADMPPPPVGDLVEFPQAAAQVRMTWNGQALAWRAPKDVALVVAGVVKAVATDRYLDEVPAPETGELIEFPHGQAQPRMTWNGQALSWRAPKDVALVVAGVVEQVWRDSFIDEVPAPATGELVEFAPLAAVCGMAWDGATLAPPPPPPPSEFDYSRAIEMHFELTARARGYASADRLATYAASTIAAWAAEAQAFVAWRDAVWLYAYTQLGLVKAGQRPQPSVAALLDELPAITWPPAA